MRASQPYLGLGGLPWAGLEGRPPPPAIPTVPTTRWTGPNQMEKVLVGLLKWIYTIFEGTSEIQRLVIARAISGVHIK